MKTPIRRYSKNRGFTVIELLTTIAIVGILIGLLVPALGLVRKTAYQIKQKSQFHTIGIGLEGYQSDFGEYPPSSYDPLVDDAYCGAQKLAEAMVGYDGFGVHVRSELRSDGLVDWDGDGTYTSPGESVYYPLFDETNETKEENLAARKGPYLEIESANAVKLGYLYDTADIAPLNEDTYVLADMFGKVKNKVTKKNTGMPILYYKANTNGTLHKPRTTEPDSDFVFVIRDNRPIYNVTAPFETKPSHPLDDSTENIFYDRTANPNFPGPPRRPYRSESYILHSAGPDGLYGSADDIYNFDTEQSGM